MRTILATVLFGFLFAIMGTEPARSENASFKLTNSAPHIIWVKLFSQTRRGWQWPSSTRHWILDDGRQHTLTAGQCQPGEKICYGGSYQNRASHWGVGLSGKRGCARCCITCGQSHAWNLTSGASDVASRPAGGQVIDHGPELVPVDD
jgi:hypothetical protein